MERYSFLTYLRLKIIVTLLRTLVHLLVAPILRRDRILTESLDVRRERIKIPSRDPHRFIDAIVYSPKAIPASKSPVLINWHASGFILPLLGSDSLYCSRIAHETGVTVVDADYRKGPETTFPGPLEDAMDTLRWVKSQTHFDSTRIGVSGFSAGGNIALSAASSLRKELHDAQIRIAVAVYPLTDMTLAPEAKRVPEPVRPQPPFLQHLYMDCYAPDKRMRSDPRVSPSVADPADFPQTVAIVTCSGDVLEPEATALANRLDDGKRRLVQKNLSGVRHGFDKGCKKGTNEWNRREEAYDVIVKVLKDAL